MRNLLLSLALITTGAAYGQVEVTELEHAAPDDVTVVDCPAVFTVPITLNGLGVENGAAWSLEDHRCRGFEGLTIGRGMLIARKRRGLQLRIRAHLVPSFDRLMRGRVDLLTRDEEVLVSREFSMEVEEDRWNEKRIKLGVVEDLSRIASLALAVYSINED